MRNEADIEFFQAFWDRRPIVTYVLVAANILIFILMEFAGGATNEAVLMAFGVKSNVLMNQGQYWRFVTPIFIHIGLLHIGFNMYALWIVGPLVERLYGGAKFSILYLLTGICGVAASYWYHPLTLSAGASGAIFGLFGVLLVYGIRHRDHIPPSFRKAVGTGVVPVIVINLIIGFSISAIDNSAHLGGLLSGMLLAAVIPFEKPRSTTPVVFTVLQYVLFAIVLGCFYEVAVNYDGPKLSASSFVNGLGEMIGRRSSAENFIDIINASERAFGQSLRAIASGEKMDTASADLAGAIDQLKRVPSLGASADHLTTQMLGVLQDEYGLLQEVRRSGGITPAQRERAGDIGRNYSATVDSLNKWVDSEGERYGIQLRKGP